MLLRQRSAAVAEPAATPHPPFQHLPPATVSLLRWLTANRIDFVLIGDVARAVRGDRSASGPVAIVPAPYGRNLDRLSRALWSARAKRRAGGGDGVDTTVPVRLTADRLVGDERWLLRCDGNDLDVEGRPAGSPRYQELLYESARMTLADELTVEVAAPEDIEHYDHLRRTGRAPEMTVRRLSSAVDS